MNERKKLKKQLRDKYILEGIYQRKKSERYFPKIQRTSMKSYLHLSQ